MVYVKRVRVGKEVRSYACCRNSPLLATGDDLKKKKGLKEVQGKGDIGIKVAMGDGAPKAPGKQP